MYIQLKHYRPQSEIIYKKRAQIQSGYFDFCLCFRLDKLVCRHINLSSLSLECTVLEQVCASDQRWAMCPWTKEFALHLQFDCSCLGSTSV